MQPVSAKQGTCHCGQGGWLSELLQTNIEINKSIELFYSLFPISILSV